MTHYWYDSEGNRGSVCTRASGVRIDLGATGIHDLSPNAADELGRALQAVAAEAKMSPRTFENQMPDGPFWVGYNRYREAIMYRATDGVMLIDFRGRPTACSALREWTPCKPEVM